MALSGIPRGPLYLLDKSQGNPDQTRADISDKYGRKILECREYLREEAIRTARLNIEIPQIPKYIEWLNGNQWDTRRPKYRSKFFDNRLAKARYDKLSLLTNSRPTIDVFTKQKPFETQAGIARDVIQFEWSRQDMDVSTISVVDMAMLWGTAFCKLTCTRPGIMRAVPCGPDNVLPIHPGWHIQESAAVLYKTWRMADYFKRVFPFMSKDIEREGQAFDYRTFSAYQRPGHIDEYTWNSMSPAMRRVIGIKVPNADLPSKGYAGAIELQEFTIDDPAVNESKYDVIMKDPYMRLEQHDYWYVVKPGERLYPRKRLLVFGGKRLVSDGPAPYFHGLYPFGCLRLNPVPWSFWGLSTYRNLMPLNQAINEIGAGTMDLIKRALNPIAVTKLGAVPASAWKEFFADMPGSKLQMGPMGNPQTDLRYMEPPLIPSYVFEMLAKFFAPEYDRMSGFVDITSMAGKKQVPGGDTIEQMRDTQQTSIQLEGRYIEVFLRDLGVLALSNVFQFYTIAQRMRILGADGMTLQDFDYDPGMMMPSSIAGNAAETKRLREIHWKNFSLSIKPGSLHGGAKDREKQVAMAMFQMNAISRQELLRRMEIGNVDQILAEIKQELQEKMTGGMPPEVLQAIQQLMAGGGGEGGGAPGGAAEAGPRMTRGQRNGAPV